MESAGPSKRRCCDRRRNQPAIPSALPVPEGVPLPGRSTPRLTVAIASRSTARGGREGDRQARRTAFQWRFPVPATLPCNGCRPGANAGIGRSQRCRLLEDFEVHELDLPHVQFDPGPRNARKADAGPTRSQSERHLQTEVRPMNPLGTALSPHCRVTPGGSAHFSTARSRPRCEISH